MSTLDRSRIKKKKAVTVSLITIDVNLHVGVMDNSRCDSVILKNVDVEGGKLIVDNVKKKRG